MSVGLSALISEKVSTIIKGLFVTSMLAGVVAAASAKPANAQATAISERTPITIYEDVNPGKPRYEYSGPTLLQNIRVIDGKGNPPVERQDVLVADGKIAGVGPTGSLRVPEGAKVIAGTGLTVMPGLIEGHGHLVGGWRGGNDNGNRPLYIKWQLLTYLYAGVTQVYDIGNIPDIGADTRDAVAAGAWMGPDIITAGTYFESVSVGAAGSNTLLTVNDPGVIGGHLDTMKEVYGVEMVKCHSGTSSQVLMVLVREAHKRNMRVVCDLWQNNGNPWIATQTGLDGYAHNMFMALEPTKRDAEILKNLGTFVITTSVMGDILDNYRAKQDGDYISGNPFIEDVQPPVWVAKARGEELKAASARYSGIFAAILPHLNSDQLRAHALSWTKTLVDAGALVGLGTDAPYPGNWTGESIHREMELWVNGSGVTPLRTIQAATYDNARILKIEKRTGSIQAGLEGDLLVVRGNPAQNISDTRNIVHVFNNGKIVDRKSLTRQWKH